MDNHWFVPHSASQRMEWSLTFDGVNCHLSRRWSHLGICLVFLSCCVCHPSILKKFRLGPIPVIMKKLISRELFLHDFFFFFFFFFYLRLIIFFQIWCKARDEMPLKSEILTAVCLQKQRNALMSERALVSFYHLHTTVIMLHQCTVMHWLVQLTSALFFNQLVVLKC